MQEQKHNSVVPKIVLAFLAVCVSAPMRGVAQEPLVREGTTVKVAEGVYVIPDGRVNLVPNVGIIIGQRGILVVDTGMGPTNAQHVLNEARKLSPKPIRYLTVTHFHPEHGMGAQAFPPETIVVYPKAQRDELRDKGPAYIKMFSGFSPEIAALLKDVKIVSPDVVYEHEAELDLEDVVVQLFHFGAAHTRGDSFVFLPKQRILFTGDVVVNRFFPIMPDADASGSNWIRILDRLEKLGPAIIIPGHGAVGDAKLIVAMRDYLAGVRTRVEELQRAGQPIEKIEAQLIPEIRTKYKDWDNPEWIKNALENFYNELNRK